MTVVTRVTATVVTRVTAKPDTRVRFLRNKAYPHPAGPKRLAGSTHKLPRSLAERWERAGLVKVLDTMQYRVTDLADFTRASLADLPAALAGVDDRVIIEAAAAQDDRKGAAPLYEARLAELGD